MGNFRCKHEYLQYFLHALIFLRGDWIGPDYRVAYAMSNSPFGPFERVATILEQDSQIATGAGHHSVINTPGTDRYYIVYHRRPLGETGRDTRVTCVDEMNFNPDGTILQVVMTLNGVIGGAIENI